MESYSDIPRIQQDILKLLPDLGVAPDIVEEIESHLHLGFQPQIC